MTPDQEAKGQTSGDQIREAGEPTMEIVDFPNSGDRDFKPALHDRERTRETLALRILALIAILPVVILFTLISGKIDKESAKDLIGVTMTPLVAVFATVVGFYFSSENKI